MVGRHDITMRALGNSGLVVAPLSLGSVKLGRNQQVKYPTPVHIPDDREATALLHHARELGINLIDTAPAYGHSEERLGKLLAGQHNHWLICTKVGEEFDGTASRHDFSAEHCRFSVERSLQRLQVDILDIVLIHSSGDDLTILNHHGTLEALLDLKRAGKIRAVGISHKTIAGARLALAQGADVIMATLNKQHTEELALIAEAAQSGCGVLIKKALSSGHASAADLGWVATREGVHSVVVGTTNPQHLSENMASVCAV